MGATTRTGPIQTIESEVAMLLRRAEASRRAVPNAAHIRLDRAAYVMLRHLAADGPVNAGVLAAALRLDASTVTRQVAAMERDSLVRRERDPRDRRATVISATEAGLARLRLARRVRAELYEEILADWSEADRRTLASMLHRLNQSLDAHARAALDSIRRAARRPGG